MKTLTEFSGFALRDAHKKSKELREALQTKGAEGAEGGEGRSAEELSSAHHEALHAFVTEKFKIAAERLPLFVHALEMVEAKPKELENLKRVVVSTVAEGEKTPGSLHLHEGHAYLPEYLASLRPKAQPDRRQARSKKQDRGRRRPPNKGKRPDGGPERRGANPPAK